MEIEIKNIPTHKLIPAIKAFRMAFQKKDGNPYSLIEAKNVVCEARDKAINGVFSLHGIRRKQHYDKPITFDFIKDYITSDNSKHFYSFGHGGCGLNGIEIVNHRPTKVKFDTKGRQVFNVPNDEDGRKFLADMAKYINRERVGFKNRGRGSRKNAGDKNFLPLEHAEWVAVYVYPKS
jgi:hypothetical protein